MTLQYFTSESIKHLEQQQKNISLDWLVAYITRHDVLKPETCPVR